MDGSTPSILPHDLYARPGAASSPLLLDVRRADAFNADDQVIVGAMHRAPETIAGLQSDPPLNREVVADCVHGHEVSQTAAARIAACAVACAVSMALSQTGVAMIALDRMTLGAPPNEFEFARTGQGAPGQWEVVADPTAVGGRAIEQTSQDRTDYRFPLAIYKSLSALNADVALRFKPVAGRIDQAGGIAVRLRDADNYYVVRANALEDNVRFYRVVKGRREQRAGVDTKVTSNEWHTLGLKAEGDQFTITFDDRTLFTAIDATFGDAGNVALWTKADSVTRFDRVEIKTLP